MKKLFTSLLMLGALLFSNSCVTTQQIPGTKKGDNTIVIHTTDNTADAFLKIGQILTSSGFAIAHSDATFFTISTDARNTSRLNGSEKFTVTVKGGETTTIELNGLVSVNVAISYGYGVTVPPSWSRITNTGMSGSVIQVGWTDLYNVATQYPNATITFEKRQ